MSVFRMPPLVRATERLDQELREPLDLLALLTVFMLVVAGPQIWYFHTPIVAMAVCAMCFRSLVRTTQFWYLSATLIGTVVYLNWEGADNHKYLICYWCLALCCAFSMPPKYREQGIMTTSRLLLALCMLLSVAWKAATPDYLNGEFFHYTLMIDERFESFARWFGSLPQGVVADNRQLIGLLQNGHLRGIEVSSVTLDDAGGMRGLVGFMTWWTILIEGLIGLLFCLPDRRWINRTRNTCLLLFATTTYAVATVRGFGWMLMMLGFAQCKREQKGFKLAYLGTFILVQLYALPYEAVVNTMLNYFESPPCCRELVSLLTGTFPLL